MKLDRKLTNAVQSKQSPEYSDRPNKIVGSEPDPAEKYRHDRIYMGQFTRQSREKAAPSGPLDNQQEAMITAPDDEIPACPMPKPAKQEHH